MRSSIKLFFLLCTLMTLWSCEKNIVEEENESKPLPAADSKLNILTRAPGDEGVISYPVTVYVMDADGICVKRMTLNDGDDELETMLAAGNYQVYAIAGATSGSYTLPTVTEATATSEIALKEGATEADLMTASSSIKIGQEETNILTLALSRKVMQLQHVEINHVPADVTAVTVSIYPISKGLLLNGTYTEETVEQSVNLERLSDGTTWCSTNSRNLMPAVGGATVKVTLTDATGLTSYTYPCPQALEANHHVNITGQYIGTQGIRMEGSISGAVWGDDVTVNFTFGEGSSTEEPEDPLNPEEGVEEGNAPAANTKYKDCMVISVNDDDTGNYKLVTLLHKKAVAISGTDKTEDAVKAEIAAALPSFDIEGITGWRLPTEAEAKAINLGPFNSLFGEDAEATPLGNSIYYFADGDNIKGFVVNGSYNLQYSLGQYLRPVKTLKFHK